MSPAAPSQWRFATVDEVATGSWQLPSNAPAGRYRVWLRPNREFGGQTTKGTWSAPVEFTSRGPIYRTIDVTVQGEKLTWASVPGASGYRVTIHHENGTAGNYQTRVFNITSTEFQIPDELIDGTYSVTVQGLTDNDQVFSPPASMSIQHGTSPSTWNISSLSNTITWNTVPNPGVR